jgi:Ca2+:H+ antiporter
MLFAVLIASHMTNDGESNWFAGLQLLFVYALLVVVFAFA